MPDPIDYIAEMLAEVESDLPEALRNHIATAIPALVETTAPTDTDSAILAQGVLAHNLNSIFKAFEGLPLVAIPLYIGQLNTVNQGILLSALELIDELPGNRDFEIIDPKDGQAYLPGDVRFQVRPKNADINQVAVEIGEHAPIALEWDSNGYFWGFARLEDAGSYTASVTVLFADDEGEATTATGDVSFSIDPNADKLPEGDDFGPVQYSYDDYKRAKDRAETAIKAEEESVSLVRTLAATAKKHLSAAAKWISGTATAADEKLGELVTANSARGLSPGDIQVLTIIGELDIEIDSVYSEAAQTYFQNNPHPSSGYASSPKVLSGAAAAMNEKYGPGTVWYEGM